MSDLRCGVLRAALDEPLHGTAPTAPRGWLLLEHPGPWPAEETDADLPPGVVEFMGKARKLKIRPQLIRRTRGRRRSPHQVYLAFSGPQPWLRGAEVADLREVVDLDLAALARGEHLGFGAAEDRRIVLVCAHGRHDPCCAHAGRPVADALGRELGEAAWETTHLGGHRFAATAVTLPEGTYHGALDPTSGPAVGAASLRGEVVLAHYRGKAGLSGAAQSAEWFARSEFGVVDVAAVAHQGSVDADDQTTRVDLLIAGRLVSVTVRKAISACARALSCGASELERPDTHVLVGIETHVAA
ncbi:MAG TPA: sucrase ferredoxin [Sporichthya sp.]|nr:sucrase ferredoxin [Sporichthya sp.]